MAAVYQIRHVTKEYPMGQVVVRVLPGIDLTIEEREFVVML